MLPCARAPLRVGSAQVWGAPLRCQKCSQRWPPLTAAAGRRESGAAKRRESFLLTLSLPQLLKKDLRFAELAVTDRVQPHCVGRASSLARCDVAMRSSTRALAVLGLAAVAVARTSEIAAS